MNNLYKIAKSDNAILRVFYDEDAMNPRTEWDNLGTMVCFHSRYILGDKHNYGSPEEFLQELGNELFGYTDVDWIQRTADKFMKECYVKYDESNEEYDVWANGSIYDSFETEDDAILELEHVRQNYIDDIYENMSTDELLEVIQTKAVILPLFLYDHSGLSMSTGDFGDRWDSGQVGWIYVTREKLEKEQLSNRTNEEIEQYLINEVDTYDQYLRGDVYGFDLEILDTDAVHEYLDENEEDIDSVDADELDDFAVDNDSCWGFYGDEFDKNGLKEHIWDEHQHLVDELQYAM